MTSSTAAIQIKNALNKLDSNDYVNIELWKIQEAVNIAAPRFVGRRLPKKEANANVEEDLQGLIIPDMVMAVSQREDHVVSHTLPEDYIGFSRLVVICQKGDCSTKIYSDWIEDANIGKYLGDWGKQPSFDFEQTFHVLSSNRIRTYHNKDFDIKELRLSYYRRPQYIQMPGAPLPSGGIGKDMTWEWDNLNADLIIEEAVWILSGNTGDYNRQQISEKIIQG